MAASICVQLVHAGGVVKMRHVTRLADCPFVHSADNHQHLSMPATCQAHSISQHSRVYTVGIQRKNTRRAWRKFASPRELCRSFIRSSFLFQTASGTFRTAASMFAVCPFNYQAFRHSFTPLFIICRPSLLLVASIRSCPRPLSLNP